MNRIDELTLLKHMLLSSAEGVDALLNYDKFNYSMSSELFEAFAPFALTNLGIDVNKSTTMGSPEFCIAWYAETLKKGLYVLAIDELVSDISNNESVLSDDDKVATLVEMGKFYIDGISAGILPLTLLQYSLCVLAHLYSQEGEAYFDRAGARDCLNAAIEANPNSFFSMFALFQLARLSGGGFREKDYANRCINLIDSLFDSDSFLVSRSAQIIVPLMVLDNPEFADLLEKYDKGNRDWYSLALSKCDLPTFSRGYFISSRELNDPVKYKRDFKLLCGTAFSDSASGSFLPDAAKSFWSHCLVNLALYTNAYALYASARETADHETLTFALEYINMMKNDVFPEEHEVRRLFGEYELPLSEAISAADLENTPGQQELRRQADAHNYLVSEIGSRIETASSEIASRVDEMMPLLNQIYEKAESIEDHTSRLEDIISRTFKLEMEKLYEAAKGMPKSSYDETELQVEKAFGALWSKVEETTRRASVTAVHYLKDMPRDGIFDARGICVCACVALERELSLVFHEGWYDYLKRNYPRYLSPWPDGFCSHEDGADRRRKTGIRPFADTSFTMGNLPYFFGFRQNDDGSGGKCYAPTYDRNRGQYPIKEFIKREYEMDDPYECFTKEGGLLDRIDDIRMNYRNPAAHANLNPIGREEAADCVRTILGIDSAGEPAAENGLLYELIDARR